MLTKPAVCLPVLLMLAGCAAGLPVPQRMASAQNFCPAGSVPVCESLFEPGREIRPDRCACTDILGRR